MCCVGGGDNTQHLSHKKGTALSNMTTAVLLYSRTEAFVSLYYLQQDNRRRIVMPTYGYLVGKLVLDPLHARRRVQVLLAALREPCRLRKVAAEDVVRRHAEVHLLSLALRRPPALLWYGC